MCGVVYKLLKPFQLIIGNHRRFTLKCISHSLTPVSIKHKPTKSKLKINASARKIIERAERQLLQDRV